ncbi:hypothetical protein FKP32DRAFT_1431958 [Trametes sanguinea]|nr:hypothetical protein FKP32DRAFT_1431958 [Trametes sanguinea]
MFVTSVVCAPLSLSSLSSSVRWLLLVLHLCPALSLDAYEDTYIQSLWGLEVLFRTYGASATDPNFVDIIALLTTALTSPHIYVHGLNLGPQSALDVILSPRRVSGATGTRSSAEHENP